MVLNDRPQNEYVDDEDINGLSFPHNSGLMFKLQMKQKRRQQLWKVVPDFTVLTNARKFWAEELLQQSDDASKRIRVRFLQQKLSTSVRRDNLKRKQKDWQRKLTVKSIF